MSEAKARATVLVVEDEEYVRDSLLELLRARGFVARAARDVPEALATLERAPVDVVLTTTACPA